MFNITLQASKWEWITKTIPKSEERRTDSSSPCVWSRWHTLSLQIYSQIERVVLCFIFKTPHRWLGLSVHKRITTTESGEESVINALPMPPVWQLPELETSMSEVQRNLRFAEVTAQGIQHSCRLPYPLILPAGLSTPSMEGPNWSFLFSMTLLFP